MIACATKTHDSQAVNIKVNSVNAKGIKVTYSFNNACDSVGFLNKGSIRKSWKIVSSCGALIDNGLALDSKSCHEIEVYIPSSTVSVDRSYPEAYSIGNLGMLVHTSLLSIDSRCGTPNWEFFSPEGETIINAQSKNKRALILEKNNPDISSNYIFLSNHHANSSKIFIDDNVPQWIKSSVSNTGRLMSSYYFQRYQGIKLLEPAIFVNNVSDGGYPSYQADVSGKSMMRFAFYNYKESDYELNSENVEGLIAHEYAHLIQPKNLFSNFPPLLYEGEAEFMRWISLGKLELTDERQLAAYISKSISDCLKITEGKPWKNVPDSIRNYGLAPYACGLTFNFISFASRSHSLSAESVLKNLYLQFDGLEREAIESYLECNGSTACGETWANKFLYGDESVESLVRNQLLHLKMVRSLVNVPPNSAPTYLSAQLFQYLMGQHCGSSGFWVKEDHFLTEAIPGCDGFEEPLRISKINDISLFNTPDDIIESQKSSCNFDKSVKIESLDNKIINIPCHKPFVAAYIYFQFDNEKIKALLN